MLVAGTLAVACGSSPGPPEPARGLRVSIKSRVVSDGVPVPIKRGQVLQLEVELVRRDGTVTDVTADPGTSYAHDERGVGIVVTKAGRVAPLERHLDAVLPESVRRMLAAVYDQVGSVGEVRITHGRPGDAESGSATVRFEVTGTVDPERGEALVVAAPRTVLRVGETVQLRVTRKLPGETPRELTQSATGTRYFTTGESRLIVEPDGQVTGVGTGGQPEESAIIGARYTDAAGDEVSGRIQFTVLPDGPGPGLDVRAEKTELREGEQTWIRVHRPAPDGGREDVSRSAATRYLTFPGHGVHDPSVVRIDATGLASAAASIGRYNRRSVVVFVRHEDRVGWVTMQILRRTSPGGPS